MRGEGVLETSCVLIWWSFVYEQKCLFLLKFIQRPLWTLLFFNLCLHCWSLDLLRQGHVSSWVHFHLSVSSVYYISQFQFLCVYMQLCCILLFPNNFFIGCFTLVYIVLMSLFYYPACVFILMLLWAGCEELLTVKRFRNAAVFILRFSFFYFPAAACLNLELSGLFHTRLLSAWVCATGLAAAHHKCSCAADVGCVKHDWVRYNGSGHSSVCVCVWPRRSVSRIQQWKQSLNNTRKQPRISQKLSKTSWIKSTSPLLRRGAYTSLFTLLQDSSSHHERIVLEC